MERKEETIAAKILVDFIRDVTVLSQKQLMAVRSMMETTVQEVVESVAKMNQLATIQKQKANEVLLLDDKNQTVRSNLKDVEKREQDYFEKDPPEVERKNILESQLMRAGGTFSKHMEALSRTDSELSTLVFRVVGSMSMDDLMAQRLVHVISSLGILQRELSEVLREFKKYNTPDAMTSFRNRVLSEVYLSYSAESEREIFHQVFGHPKEMRRAS